MAWNLLKDYLEHEGIVGLIGSRDTTREAFKSGVIVQGEEFIDMIKARSQTSHTYNLELADQIASDILNRFYPAFVSLLEKFTELQKQDNNL